MRRPSARLAILALLLLATTFGAGARAQLPAIESTYLTARKVMDGLDRDQSREHVSELRGALDQALKAQLRSGDRDAFRRSTMASPDEGYKLLGRLAVLEGRPAEALRYFEQGALLTEPGSRARAEFERAKAAALALNGQTEAARRQLASAGPAPAGNCFGIGLQWIDISWADLAQGPHGTCVAAAFERAAQQAEDQSLLYLIEPFRRLAIEAATAARAMEGESADQAVFVSVNNLAAWLVTQRREDEANALIDRHAEDPGYAAIYQAITGRPLARRAPAATKPKEAAAPSATAAATSPAKRSAAEIDRDIASANRRRSEAVRRGGIHRSNPGAPAIVAASRQLSVLYREKGDLAKALQANLDALNYVSGYGGQGLPLRADLGPAAPDCPPGAMAQPSCRAWYPEFVQRYSSLDVADLLAERAVLEGEAGNGEEALLVDRFGGQVLANWLSRNWNEAEDVAAALKKRAVLDSDRLAVFARYRERKPLAESAKARAFEALQLLQFNRVEAGVRAAVARGALASPAVRDRLQERQRLQETLRRTDGPREREALARRIAALESGLPFSASDFDRRTTFRSLSIEEARRLLRPDEALVIMVPLEDRTEIMAVTATSSLWVTSQVSAGWIRSRVQRLRAHLDSPGGAGGGFDRQAAFELFDRLFRPLREVVGEKLLYVSAAAPLDGIPFGILVTEPPAGSNRDAASLRATRWFFQRNPVVTLPSVPALAWLRSRPSQAPRVALVGFGGAETSGSTRDEEVRSGLAPLPFAARELELLAAAQRGPVQVFVGARATERRVRDTDLRSAGILAFATHAIRSAASNEPGLVLTPGDGGSADDGFLSASEVALLPLGTDVAVLSACSTAGEDGRGGEALSGLALSFLYAGSRAVVATHWPVVDEAAAGLMVSTIGPDRDVGTLARRLARAMGAMLADPASAQSADPRMWGPYAIVGG